MEEIKADSNYFQEILSQYNKNPKATLVSLFSDTLADALVTVQDKFIVDVTGERPTLWLKLNQETKEKRAEEPMEEDEEGVAP